MIIIMTVAGDAMRAQADQRIEAAHKEHQQEVAALTHELEVTCLHAYTCEYYVKHKSNGPFVPRNAGNMLACIHM
jgi:hypothetical protein